MHKEFILILDFGSQYTQLIARRIRELNTYCEIHPYHLAVSVIREMAPKGIVLSGGPSSVYQKDAPLVSKEIFELGIPVLGICYGMQLMAHLLGGKVESSTEREFGFAELNVTQPSRLLQDIGPKTKVWMSHGDRLAAMPTGFQVVGNTGNAPMAAIAREDASLYGIQFHPEVQHTAEGMKFLANFVNRICGCTGSWTSAAYIEETVARIRQQVGSSKVLLGLSGGVDSAVAAVLLHKAIGAQLTCMFIDNGVLRFQEVDRVAEVFRRNYDIQLVVVDAAKEFLDDLQGITEPEEKRKRIGTKFIEVFERESKKIGQLIFWARDDLSGCH